MTGLRWAGHGADLETFLLAFFEEQPRLLPLWRLLETDWPPLRAVNERLYLFVTDGLCCQDGVPILHHIWGATLDAYREVMQERDRPRLLFVLTVLTTEAARWLAGARVAAGEVEWHGGGGTPLSEWLAERPAKHITVGTCGASEAAVPELARQLLEWLVPQDREGRILREAWHDGRKEEVVVADGRLDRAGGVGSYRVRGPELLDRKRERDRKHHGLALPGR